MSGGFLFAFHVQETETYEAYINVRANLNVLTSCSRIDFGSSMCKYTGNNANEVSIVCRLQSLCIVFLHIDADVCSSFPTREGDRSENHRKFVIHCET